MDARVRALATVAGVDAARGLAQVGGRAEVYRRLLQRFVATHAQDGARLCALLGRGDGDAAAALVHGLRGAAVTLALVEVEAAAWALESALDAGVAAPDALAPAQRLHTVLQALLPQLARVLCDTA